MVLPGGRPDPDEPGGGDASQRALDTAKEVLEGGSLLGIYPEGTRSPDVRLHKGHTGVARLAIGCGVPIIPVGIVGTRAIQPPGRRLMRPFHPVTVRFGPPLICSETEGSNGKRMAPAEVSANGSGTESEQVVLRKWTDRLMEAIADLSRQDYVDEYANRSKAATSATAEGAGSSSSSPNAGPGSGHRPKPQGGAVNVAS